MRIRDGKNSESGINIPDPQHWLLWYKVPVDYVTLFPLRSHPYIFDFSLLNKCTMRSRQKLGSDEFFDKLDKSKYFDLLNLALLCYDYLPCIADDERPEDRSNTGSRASHSHSGGSGSYELGGRVDVSVGGRGLESPGGHSLPLHPYDHSAAARGHS